MYWFHYTLTLLQSAILKILITGLDSVNKLYKKRKIQGHNHSTHACLIFGSVSLAAVGQIFHQYKKRSLCISATIFISTYPSFHWTDVWFVRL